MFQLCISPEEIERLEMVSFPGRIHVITHPGLDFARAIAYLKRQDVLGFDTETKPVFNSWQRHNGVALLQLSGPDRAYLFRIQELGMRRRLCGILANPRIIKVGAASGDDVRGLQRYCRFDAQGFVELQKEVWQWGIRDKSVKKMAAIILGVRISKTQQLSNWEAEELSDAQKKYAATDAWICREMYLKLQQCEKHPLSPEEMLPPEQLPAALKPGYVKPVKEEAPAKKKHRPKHRRPKKKQTTDDKSNTEKGA